MLSFSSKLVDKIIIDLTIQVCSIMFLIVHVKSTSPKGMLVEILSVLI